MRTFIARALLAAGLERRLFTYDRQILEKVVLPHLSRQEWIRSVLFVGCAAYTKHYAKFFRSKQYTTIDIDPQSRRFGAERHIIDDITNISEHFSDESLDVIICNGVLGFGLNAQQDVETMLSRSYNCLRRGGLLLIGWNDTPHLAVPFERCPSLTRYERYVFPRLENWRVLARGSLRHTFDFYRRPAECAEPTLVGPQGSAS